MEGLQLPQFSPGPPPVAAGMPAPGLGGVLRPTLAAPVVAPQQGPPAPQQQGPQPLRQLDAGGTTITAGPTADSLAARAQNELASGNTARGYGMQVGAGLAAAGHVLALPFTTPETNNSVVGQAATGIKNFVGGIFGQGSEPVQLPVQVAAPAVPVGTQAAGVQAQRGAAVPAPAPPSVQRTQLDPRQYTTAVDANGQPYINQVRGGAVQPPPSQLVTQPVAAPVAQAVAQGPQQSSFEKAAGLPAGMVEALIRQTPRNQLGGLLGQLSAIHGRLNDANAKQSILDSFNDQYKESQTQRDKESDADFAIRSEKGLERFNKSRIALVNPGALTAATTAGVDLGGGAQ